MKRIRQLWTLARHFGRVRNSLSTLADLYSGGTEQSALGGLTAEEIDWLSGRVRAAGAKTVVEIGTLFGFTARRIRRDCPQTRVIAVDNFCWNPFGLPADAHERFARSVLDGSGVELVNGDAEAYLADRLAGAEVVCLDGDHRYEAVRREIELVRRSGARWLSGHDYGNPLFGVTRAVDEAFGRSDATGGMCWIKELK